MILNFIKKLTAHKSFTGVGLCKIRGCETLVSDVQDYKRHLLFHCYHAKLQCRGAEVVVKNAKLRQSNIQCVDIVEKHPNNVYYPGDVLRCAWSDCQVIFFNFYVKMQQKL